MKAGGSENLVIFHWEAVTLISVPHQLQCLTLESEHLRSLFNSESFEVGRGEDCETGVELHGHLDASLDLLAQASEGLLYIQSHELLNLGQDLQADRRLLLLAGDLSQFDNGPREVVVLREIRISLLTVRVNVEDDVEHVTAPGEDLAPDGQLLPLVQETLLPGGQQVLHARWTIRNLLLLVLLLRLL